MTQSREMTGAPAFQLRWAGGWLPKTINLVFSILLTFFGLLFVTFLIGRVIPIDPVLAIVFPARCPVCRSPHSAQSEKCQGPA